MEMCRTQAWKFDEITSAIRQKEGSEGSLAPSEMLNAIKRIKNRRVKAGCITLKQNSRSITVPAYGKMINVIGTNVPQENGYVTQVMWLEGLNENLRTQVAISARITDASTNPVEETQNASLAVYAIGQDQIMFDTSREDRLFAAGATYLWICYDWDDGAVEAVYDVAAANQSEVELGDVNFPNQKMPAKLILISNGDETYTAYLLGKGKTTDFLTKQVVDGEETDVELPKPWENYIDAITAIVVGKDITSVGDCFFRRHEAVQSLIFEDSSAITHLGNKAFQGCQFGGELSFPSLTDAELGGTFSHCINLRGLTLNGNVKSIGAKAFSGCLKLRYVHGLHGVTAVGDNAFSYTPKLEDVDLSPNVCTSMGASAFLLSGAMRYADPSAWPNTQMGDNAIPAKTYSSDMLSKIRAVRLPHVAPREVNAEASYQYTDIDYCMRDGKQMTIGDYGCMALGLYHLYNWYNGVRYRSFRDWWQNEILDKYVPVKSEEGKEEAEGEVEGAEGEAEGEEVEETSASITDCDIEVIQQTMATTLGWQPRAGFPITTPETGSPALTDPVAAKRAIAAELSAGRALVANMAMGAGHSLVIIGSNAATDKLIVVDSIRTSGDKGCIFEIAFEQLFGNFANCKLISYGPPDAQ